MVTKEQIKEVVKNPKLAYYYFKGWLIYWLIRRYLIRLEKKKKSCPECYKEGQCKKCECPFTPLALSGKFCQYVGTDNL